MSTGGGLATRRMTPEEIAAVLLRYGIRAAAQPSLHGGGTANSNAVVQTDRGPLFVKRRNPRYSAEGCVAFDHSLMEYLAPRRVGTPLALRTLEGTRWLRLEGSVYEVYPWMSGEPHDRHSVQQVAAAGRALAAYHDAVRHFPPPAGKEWPRYRDPAVIRDGLRGIEAEVAATLAAPDAEYLRGQVEAVSLELTDEKYHSLPKLVVHGDYHPGNVLYQDGEVAGIFDLDWATVQPRVLDLADGLMLFAGERDTEIDDADIVSLTQTWRPSRDRGRAFLDAYLEREVLTDAEMCALPFFVRALWLSCRVEGMEKVPEGGRVAYLLDGLLAPLRAMDAAEAQP